MTIVSAILLASGESPHAGGNKLVLPIDGIPLVRRTLEMLLTSRLHEIIVVTGYEHEKVAALIDDLPARIVVNRHYRAGQVTSLCRGLEALDDSAEGVMVCLADQPQLQAEDIDTLIDAFGRRSGGSLLVPTWQGKYGNPVILSREYRKQILAAGCTPAVIAEHSTRIEVFPMQNNHVDLDIDTREDFELLQRLIGKA